MDGLKIEAPITKYLIEYNLPFWVSNITEGVALEPYMEIFNGKSLKTFNLVIVLYVYMLNNI